MGTTAEKLTYLNTTKGLIKDSINLTGAGITNDTFRSYANKLKLGLINALNDNGDTIYSNLEKVSGKGSNLSLTPTYEAPMRNREIYGNTYQSGTATPSSPIPIESVTGNQNVTICGKNMLDISDITNIQNVTRNEDVITISGAFVSTSWSLSKPFTLKANTTYTMSLTNTYANAGNSAFILRNGTTNIISLKLTDNSISYTPSQDIIIDTLRLYYTTTTFDNYSFSVQLEVGSSSSTYEPYNGNTYEVNLGKNLFDKDNGFRNGYINADGVFTSENITATFNQYIQVKENTNYTLSVNTNIRSINFAYYDSSKTFLSREQATNNTSSKTITTPVNCKYIVVIFSYSSSDTMTQEIIDGLNPMLEKGSQATSYSPYFTPIELNKIGDYEDSIKKSTGKNIITTYNYASSGYINYNYDNSKIGKTMTYSFIPNFSTTNATLYIRANTSISSYNVGTISTITSGTKVSVTFTLTDEQYNTIKNTTGGYIQVYKSGVSMDENSISNPMLEINNQATDYEPYGKVWYIEKNIGKVVLDGSETSINLFATLTNVCRFVIEDVFTNDIQTTILSNYFKWYSNQNKNNDFNNTANDMEAIHIRDDLDGLGIKINKTTASTVNELRTWLGTNKPEILYQLATPIYTTITNTELIEDLETLYNAKSKNGTTNISVDGSLPAILNVSALKSE